MNYVGIDWAYGRAAWCAMGESGEIECEGLIPADEDGLARLVLELGTEVKGCVEMMSGAVRVRDQLALAGWEMEVAHGRKVIDAAPLAFKDRQGRRQGPGRALPARPGEPSERPVPREGTQSAGTWGRPAAAFTRDQYPDSIGAESGPPRLPWKTRASSRGTLRRASAASGVRTIVFAAFDLGRPSRPL